MPNLFSNIPILMCSQLFLLFIFSGIASAGQIVDFLPGYDGDLPFSLQTGYIGVGPENESQLFYYFVESQRSPAFDPVMLWLAGDPGCSVLSSFFYENGPLEFDYKYYTNGSLPRLHINPYAWTQSINIIYVDAPTGTGFSHSTTQENYYINDTEFSKQTYQFLRKWLSEHPQYLTNQLFIGGNSYSGIILPIIVQEIIDGNEAGLEPQLNLKGYILGNPNTDSYIDNNSRIPFAHRLSLVSDELYEDAKASCGGDYINVDANNTECIENIYAIDEMLLEINLMNILEPVCKNALRQHSHNFRDLIEIKPKPIYWCRDYNYVFLEIWANDENVREALNVRENTTGVWKRCNISLAYTKNIPSSLNYHFNLTSADIRGLVYSGDHDMSVTYIGTQNWISLLDLTISEYWRAWFVDGQVAGYTEKYLSDGFTFIYATIKGAGHLAPEYKPKECYAMIDRFMAYFPL